MDDVKPVMIDLLIAALQTANGLLQKGHVGFQPFAVALAAHGCKLCFVSDDADFLPVLSSQPLTVEPRGPQVTAIGPSMTTECLAANRTEGATFWTRYDAVIERLRTLAVAGEVVATAVAYREDDEDEDGNLRSQVQIELEHANGWTLLWNQPFEVVNGELRIGEENQYDHDSEVFNPDE